MMVKQKFTWFFDMATSADNVQNLKVYAGGEDIFRRLQPFFAAYKHYKLGSVKLKFVAAATLPVDPTGLSYEVGEQTADPRDLFNPGLVRITNGEDVAPIVSMNQYYATLLDPRWYKFNMQKGFMRSATPLYWGVGQIRQDLLPGHVINTSATDGDRVDAIYPFSLSSASADASSGLSAIFDKDSSSSYALFQTGQKIRMGWLPTDYSERIPTRVMQGAIGTTEIHGVNLVPEVPLLDIVLPKSHKTKFYYRVYVEETVYFKDAVAINPYPYAEDSDYFNLPVDRFIYDSVAKAAIGSGQYYSIPGAISGSTPIQNYGGGLAQTPIDQSYDDEGGNGE